MRVKGAPKTGDFPIIGIGASAGGLEALETFFRNMPEGRRVAFVVISHLEPTHKSILAELLRRVSKMQVVEVKDKMTVCPGSVYVIPPNRNMIIRGGTLRLLRLDPSRALRLPVDFFFRSLADEKGPRAIGVLLSGSGTDGTLGARAIHEAGGICLVQDPVTAAYDGMPRSVMHAGFADHVLPVAKIPRQLLSLVDRVAARGTPREEPVSPQASSALSKILALLRRQTGHDFSLYKKSTLYRRIERQMALRDIATISGYAQHLMSHPGDVKALFKDLLIVVTGFFRDPQAFDALKAKVLPGLFEKTAHPKVIRAWVAGCATGEEAYSLAMLLTEYAERHGCEAKVQIFGTDIDEDAIILARSARYPLNIAADISPERLKRFFVKEEGAYKVKKEIREKVVFAVQDVTRDVPFTRLDLISCRNVLIYFEKELQERVIPLFHYSLSTRGILFLGSSETTGESSELFSAIDKKWKIYRRKESSSLVRLNTFDRVTLYDAAFKDAGTAKEIDVPNVGETARKMLLERFAPASVIITASGEILYFHGRTGKYLEPASGQASFNIFDMAREGLRHDLRLAVHDAQSRKRAVSYRSVNVKSRKTARQISINVTPIVEPDAMKGLMMVTFEDLKEKSGEGSSRMPRAAAKGGDKHIRALEKDLVRTRDNLQAMIEKLQASNEELKSMNEELQSTNEELQSTNEELETSREEVQSVNEELMTVNAELQGKIDQLSRAENDMRNLLESTSLGVIFLDRELRIKGFTPQATKVFSLIQTDIGRPLSDITSALEYKSLGADAHHVLRTLVFKEFEVRAKGGGWYLLRIMPYRTLDNVIDGVVVTFTDIGDIKRAQGRLEVLNRSLEAEHTFSGAIIATLREPLLVLDAGLRVVMANRAFYSFFRTVPGRTMGRRIYDLGNRQWNIPALRRLLEKILPRHAKFTDFAVEHVFPKVGRKKMLLNARAVRIKGARGLILLAMERAR